jgi:large subunit ribosomal protein L35
MPKLKTKKGVAKRYKLTKNKKVKYSPCGKGHLLTSKKTKRLRKLRKSRTISNKNDSAFLRNLMPYG